MGTRTSDSKPEEDPSFGDERDTIRARAAQAGVKYEVSKLEDQITLLIEIPNGREPPRRVRVTPELANILSRVPFEHVVALGNYDAVWDSSTGLIEASFRAAGISTGLLRLARHPQVRPIDTGQDSLSASDDEEDLFIQVQPGVPRGQEWMLRLGSEDEKFVIEISPPTGLAAFLSQGSTIKTVRRSTLKILGLTFSRHDEALKALENISSAFFFELDMLDGITLTLYRTRRSTVADSRPASGVDRRTRTALTIPQKKYSNEAISLYIYGRSAASMPLLQFLAYYQCIEYFFPFYWNAEMISRVRRTLNDPRFNSDNDNDVNRLIQMMSTRGKAGAPERDQLQATIAGCVDSDEIATFLQCRSEEMTKTLTTKGYIGGVRPLALHDKENRLTHQVANRLYDLRCRVVHSKEDGGTSQIDVLLPFSREAERLSADIVLARFLAQKAIIASRGGRLD